MLDRRQTLLGLSGFLAAPAIVRASSLMAISPIHPEWIKNVRFAYSGDDVRRCEVQFADGLVRHYQSSIGLRRVMHQVQCQMTDRLFHSRYNQPVEVTFGSSRVAIGGADSQACSVGHTITGGSLALIRDPEHQFLLSHVTPSAREDELVSVNYNHFRGYASPSIIKALHWLTGMS